MKKFTHSELKIFLSFCETQKMIKIIKAHNLILLNEDINISKTFLKMFAQNVNIFVQAQYYFVYQNKLAKLVLEDDEPKLETLFFEVEK